MDELYDVPGDPGQCVNRIADPALQPVLAGLRHRLYQGLVKRQDPFVRTHWLRDQLLLGRKLIGPQRSSRP
jgi:hypothetical protein